MFMHGFKNNLAQLFSLRSKSAICNNFFESAIDEPGIVVTTSVRCMCVRCSCVWPSGFFRTITCTFVHGFQNNLAQLFSLKNTIAI